MRRLFLAIPIEANPDLLAHYFLLRKSLGFAQISWVEPQLFHITLRFFGHTPDDHITGITTIMEELRKDYQLFQLTINSLGVFGSSYQPRVIWYGFDHSEILNKMVDQLNIELDQIDKPAGRQNFVPHMSVGRIRSLRDKNKLKDLIKRHQLLSIGQCKVRHIVLMESHVSHKGPKYEPVHTIKLE